MPKRTRRRAGNDSTRKSMVFLRILRLSLSKSSPEFKFHKLQAREIKTQLASHDSLLLSYLSHHRFQDARHLLDKFPERDRHGRVVHWTSLLTNYAKNGCIAEARALFEIMPERNTVTYNAMLSGYVKNGRLNEAYQFFIAIPEKNVVSWTSMLRGFLEGGRMNDARKLFDEMPERNVVSWNTMVAGLINSHDLGGAREVFDDMLEKNFVSFNTMIDGYAENCKMEEARELFDEMQFRNVITWTTMIAGYCRVGNVEEGFRFFRRMNERNVVSWTAMIGGFAWNGFHEEALMLFHEMMGSTDDVKPNGETFISLAYACSGMGLPCLGKQLHTQLIINSFEFDDYDIRLSKSLIHMYSVLGIMDFAHNIFILNSNFSSVQCCNSMLNGYIKTGQLEKAENIFYNVPYRDDISWTSMINGYFSVGQVSKASKLFNNMTERDVISWTTMISGLVENEQFAEANDVFMKMRVQGIVPLNSSCSVLLGAAGATSCLDHGKQLHCLMIKTQDGCTDLILENSLISMYAKCGEIDNACTIFSEMTKRDLISWNSMIMGFSNNGLADRALMIFDAMLESGTHPNSITFLGVLTACSHAGFFQKGWDLFSSMSGVYNIQPSVEHYVSMINLLGRDGKLREAEELILGLPIEPNAAIWGALLGMCRFGDSNIEIARHAAKQVLELDELNTPAYVALCNVYAVNGFHFEENVVRKEMALKGVRKVPGCSWITLKGRVYSFLSGDKVGPLVGEMLWLLFKNDVD